MAAGPAQRMTLLSSAQNRLTKASSCSAAMAGQRKRGLKNAVSPSAPVLYRRTRYFVFIAKSDTVRLSTFAIHAMIRLSTPQQAGQILIARRKTLGVSQAAASASLGISQNRLSELKPTRTGLPWSASCPWPACSGSNSFSRKRHRPQTKASGSHGPPFTRSRPPCVGKRKASRTVALRGKNAHCRLRDIQRRHFNRSTRCSPAYQAHWTK